MSCSKLRETSAYWLCNPAIVGQISARSQEQSRAEYLTRAHEALSSGRYLEALRLLESCQKEGIFSPEIAELMEFARQEADQHLKTSQLRGLLRQAQELMTQGSYRAVVELLTPVSEDPSAASLVFLLEDARDRLQSRQRDIDAALQTVEVLHPPGTLCRGDKIPGIADRLRFWNRCRFRLRCSSCAPPARMNWRRCRRSEKPMPHWIGSRAALEVLQNPGGNSESSLLTRIVPVFTSRRKSVADRQLSSAIAQAQAAMEAGDRKQAASPLSSAQGIRRIRQQQLAE